MPYTPPFWRVYQKKISSICQSYLQKWLPTNICAGFLSVTPNGSILGHLLSWKPQSAALHKTRKGKKYFPSLSRLKTTTEGLKSEYTNLSKSNIEGVKLQCNSFSLEIAKFNVKLRKRCPILFIRLTRNWVG